MTNVDAYAAIEREFSGASNAEAIARLDRAQRLVLHGYWTDRARGELTTALTFEFMLEDLLTEQAPAALVALAERAIADEHRHVDWCLR